MRELWFLSDRQRDNLITKMAAFGRDMLTSGGAACIARTAMAPMERVKLLLQLQAVSQQIAQNQQYKGIIDCLVRIPKEQGVLSYWRGNAANVTKYFTTQALNFSFKELYKPYLSSNYKKNGFLRLLGGNLAAGGLAGVSSMVITYPLDFARTRLATDIASSKHERQFRGLFDCLHKVIAKDGIRGIYRGILLSIPVALVFRATYFGMYDTAKEMISDDAGSTRSLIITFFIAQVTTASAGYLCYPMDTVRRRMVMQSGRDKSEWHYKNTLDCWKKIYKNEGGVRAFYKGAFVNQIRGVGGAMVLILYDRFK